MNSRPCIRCQHPVHLEDGHLVYCSNCGAPQIFLSQELQAELASSTRAYEERATPTVEASTTSSTEPPTPAGSRRRWNSLRSSRRASAAPAWAQAVQYALLSAGVTLLLGLLSLLLPPASILMLLWVISAPVVTVAVFHARSTAQPPGVTGFGARLGLLTGFLVAFCCAGIFTLSLVLTRYVFHDAAQLDAELAASFAQQREVVLARLGPSVQPTLNLFAIPEFRVGLLLSVIATSGMLYLVLSTLAGGVAGLLLRRRPGA